MIKYIGSKRLLLPPIVAGVTALGARTALDLFSGTSRVGHALKRAGVHVTANDHLSYAATLARCYVQADAARWQGPAQRLLGELSAIPPRPGYFTETFCERARFFQPHNGARVDAIRDGIARLGLEPELEAIALTSLMEAADRVDSTTGVQMAFLKKWAARAYNDLELRMPALLPGPGHALQLEAVEAASEVEADVAYLDPPYNQHSYMGNYHIWETLVRWDAPDAYGVAQKRAQCREYRSDFNRKRRIRDALADVIARLKCRHLLVSFNNEGHVTRPEMEALLAERGHLGVVAVDFKRYVGAQIGIHDPSGRRVGRVSHLRNTEHLFVVSPDRAAVERACRAIEVALPAAPAAAS
ncbi:MAG: DNA adenine methylase [Myxococcota bacterium]